MNRKILACFLTTLLTLAMFSGCEVKASTYILESPAAADTVAKSPGKSGKSLSKTPLTLDQAVKSGQAVQYERAVLYDRQSGCEAARTLIPAGWTPGGEVIWSFSSRAEPAISDFFAVSPDNYQQVGSIALTQYAEPGSDLRETRYEGGFSETYGCVVKTFTSVEDVAAEYMSMYFNARAEVIDVTYPQGEALAAVRQFIARKQKALDDIDARSNQMYSSTLYTESKAEGHCAFVDMLFDLNGETYKARVCCLVERHTYLLHSYATQYLPAYTITDNIWKVPLFYYYVAEQSRFDESDTTINTFAENLIVNEQWRAAVEQVSWYLTNEAIKGWWREVELISQHCAQIAQSTSRFNSQSYSGYSSESGYSSSVMNGWTNAITGNSYFEGADGGPVLLDDSYLHTYSNGSGGFVQSNDALSVPSGWNEVSGTTMWD